jgi:hypothetical protein
MAAVLTKLYNPQSKTYQAGADVAVATVGLLVLRLLGAKVEVVKIPFKDLLALGALQGFSSALGRECVDYASKKKGKQKSWMHLGAMATFSAAATVFSQIPSVRSHSSCVGRVACIIPAIGSRYQIIASLVFSILPMVAMRLYFGSSKSGSPSGGNIRNASTSAAPINQAIGKEKGQSLTSGSGYLVPQSTPSKDSKGAKDGRLLDDADGSDSEENEGISSLNPPGDDGASKDFQPFVPADQNAQDADALALGEGDSAPSDGEGEV